MTHEKSYIICATPRSGSTLLCDLLAGAGVAGRPDSFFRRESYAEWAAYFGLSMSDWPNEGAFDRTYLNAVLEEGVGGANCFGMRLMWESLEDLSNRLGEIYPRPPNDHGRLEAAFGPPLYIHLSREDKIAQAVSHLKAEQSGLWHIHADGSERERLKPAGRPVYDQEEIARLVAETKAHDAAWTRWFARMEIEPLRVTYESLSHDPQTALARILSALDLDSRISASVQPRTAKLGNSESRDWAARFRSARMARLRL